MDNIFKMACYAFTIILLVFHQNMDVEDTESFPFSMTSWLSGYV